MPHRETTLLPCRGAVRRWVAIGCLLVVAGAGGVRAQGDDDVEFDPFNFAFAAYAGSGVYANGDRTVYVFRIPAWIRLRADDAGPFGIRLSIKTTLGFYDFAPQDLVEFEFPDSLGTLSVIPGAELRFQVSERWQLKPFLDYGIAWDTETDDTVWVLGTGLRARAEYPWKQRSMVWWNELIYAMNSETGLDPFTDFARLRTKFEVRQPAGFSVGGQETAFAPYVTLDYYFDEVVLERPLLDPVLVRERYEIGLTWGTSERAKVWIISLPRVGLGYRFGQDLSTVRLVLSFAY
jgi:hypothetical protein